MRVETKNGTRLFLVGAMALAMFVVASSKLERIENPTGSARLVSVEEFPHSGEMCLWEPSSAYSDQVASSREDNLFTALEGRTVYAASQDAGQTVEVTRPPVRYIRDLDPIYSYVAVDTRRNEVFMQDANTWTIRVFNRLDNTPPRADRTEPKRLIGGPKTD